MLLLIDLLYAVWSLLAAAGSLAVGPPAPGLTLRVEPVFNGKPLVLDSAVYQTGTFDKVAISKLRFYLTAISLTYADGRKYAEPASYHLIDADPEATATLQVRLPGAPAGRLRSLTFSIGVDSAANVAGALGGDLDPARGMYWAWHSGYVNAKLEGSTVRLATPHHEFAYHIGGFQAPYNARRTLTLAVPTALAASGSLTLRADVGRWLDALPLAQQPSVQVPGAAAMEVADACARMFSLYFPLAHASR
ncbi:MbnP family protein [Hymenobacter rubidus]|uniref:MbnP family protein n=1 Tax=Hymenobacter rubidus TaxID=1441626 RepID=UPI00191DFFC2|nr:MbnP family protein [Hymenobacter rubidus]